MFIYRDCSRSLIGPEIFYKAEGCRQFQREGVSFQNKRAALYVTSNIISLSQKQLSAFNGKL